jgi:hypothetical protein
MSEVQREIKLLCPSDRCKKCLRIINDIEKIISSMNADVNFEVITELEDWLREGAWIFPTLFVNGEKIYEGYVPKYKFLKNKLKELLM